MTNEDFIRQHLHDDVRALALCRMEEGLDAKWCLQQIEGWQKAMDKLPRWAGTEGIWYPPTVPMEQCSSERTASYKAELVHRLLSNDSDRSTMTDLTGGYGIDFSYMAPLFAHSDYIERNPELCRIAEHNFSLLGLHGVDIHCADSVEYLSAISDRQDLIYIDPARRDGVGRKIVAIEDCSPDVCSLQDSLLAVSRFVVTKLSPMLDITAALSRLKCVSEVHVVSVKGECKELLFVQQAGYSGTPVFYALNMGAENTLYICTREEILFSRPSLPSDCGADAVRGFLYEPNSAILKAGLQDTLCKRYGVCKLHPMSNLFTSEKPVEDFPGRSFRVSGYSGFGKKELRSILSGVSSANLTIRNFPTTVAELRKKLRLREGGDVYLFATTIEDGSHVLIRCSKQA